MKRITCGFGAFTWLELSVSALADTYKTAVKTDSAGAEFGRKLLAFLALFAFLLLPHVATAATLNDRIGIPISVECRYATGEPQNGSIEFLSNTSYSLYRAFGSASLIPGVTYDVQLHRAEGDTYYGAIQFRVVAPPGTMVFIDGQAKRNLTRLAGQVEGFQLRIAKDDEYQSAPFGETSDIAVESLSLKIGMGKCSDGSSAGFVILSFPKGMSEVQMYSQDFWMYCQLFLGVAETSEVRRYNSDWTNVQVLAPEGLFVRTWTTSERKFRFYPRAQVTNPGSAGPWTYTGDPLETYHFTDASTSADRIMKIVRTTRFGTGSNAGTTRTLYASMKQNLQTQYYNDPSTAQDLREVREWGTAETGQVGVPLIKSQRVNSLTGIQTTTKQVVDSSSNVILDSTSAVTQSELVSSHTKGAGSADPLVTNYSNQLIAGPCEIRTDPTGAWRLSENYYGIEKYGLLKETDEPWKSSPVSPEKLTSTGVCTQYEYTTDAAGDYRYPLWVRKHVGGSLISEVTYSYSYGTQNGQPIVVTTETEVGAANGSNEVTVTRVFRDDAAPEFRGKVASRTLPDGTITAAAIQRVSYTPGSRSFALDGNGQYWRTSTISGTTLAGEGTQITNHEDWDLGGGIYVVPGKSTRTDSIRSFDGTLQATLKFIRGNSNDWILVDRVISEFAFGRFLVSTTRDSGDSNSVWTEVSNEWQSGRLTRSTDGAGIVTDFYYDDADRVNKKVRRSKSGQPGGGDLWTIETFDAMGRVRVSKVASNQDGTGEVLATERDYDTAGRLTAERVSGQSGWLQTSYAFNVDGNPRKTRKTLPDGNTVTEETYLDGRISSISGSGTLAKSYDYWVEGGNEPYVTRETVGASWSETRSDRKNRTVWKKVPTSSSDSSIGWIAEFERRNALGQVYRISRETNGQLITAPTLKVYDTMGNVLREGLDLNENGTLDEWSNDRLKVRAITVTNFEGVWWTQVQESIFTTPNSNATGMTRTSIEQLTGLSGSLRKRSRVWDENGNSTIATVSVNSSSSEVVEEVSVPGSSTPVRKVTKNGLLQSERSSTGATVSYTYDSLGRISVRSTRDEQYKELAYWPGTALVRYVRNRHLGSNKTSGAEWVEYNYDNLGRIREQRTNNHEGWSSTFTSYTGWGAVHRAWGSSSSAVEYGYDTSGRRTTMSTFRGGSGWTGSSWPGDTGKADVTTWEYHPASGDMIKKTDDQGRYVAFTYGLLGLPKTRTWSRGVVTNYNFYLDQGYRTGQLRQVTYSDGTPTVDYYYTDGSGNIDRLGRLRRVSDASGLRSVTYRSQDSQVEQVQYDSLFGTGGSQGVLKNTFEGTSGVAGRLEGYEYGTSGNTDQFGRISFQFDSGTGRISAINDSKDGSLRRSFGYAYQYQSDWVREITSGAYRRTNYWESWRPISDGMETFWNNSSREYFGYGYDWKSQPIVRHVKGESMAAVGYQYGREDQFEFSQRGEVKKSASRQLDAWSQPVGDSVGLRDRYNEWEYDQFGNRTNQKYFRELTDGGTSNNTYGVNSLNQLTSSNTPDWSENLSYDQDGNLTMDSDHVYYYDAENRIKTVADMWNWATFQYTYDSEGRRVQKRGPALVNGLRRLTWNDLGWSQMTGIQVDSNIDFDWGSGSPGAGVDPDSFIIRWSGYITVPTTGYYTFYGTTDDGLNLSIDHRWIISAWQDQGPTTYTATIYLEAGRKYSLLAHYYENGGGAMARLEWSGPGIGRQVVPSSNLWSWSTDDNATDRRYLYNGWNVVAEFDGKNLGAGAVRTFQWGMDLSHTLGGAGGVGGLLSIRDGLSEFLPCYDSNGNVHALLDGSSGAVAAWYDYSAFGMIRAMGGTYAESNPIGFASKWRDTETELLQHNYRYYSPVLGRFITRDPSEEKGGLNLYSFSSNNPIGRYDFLGLETKNQSDEAKEVDNSPAAKQRRDEERMDQIRALVAKGETVSVRDAQGTEYIASKGDNGAVLFTKRGTGGGGSPVASPEAPAAVTGDPNGVRENVKTDSTPTAAPVGTPKGESNSVVGVVANAATGAGVPTIEKDLVIVKSTRYTSPASVMARSTPQLDKVLPARVPTPTYSNINASTRNLGTLVGRAGPVVGAAVSVVEIATSENPARTATGAVFGVLGGAMGATAGTIAAIPTGGLAVPVTGGAGALAGGYAGREFGFALYDVITNPTPKGTPTLDQPTYIYGL